MMKRLILGLVITFMLVSLGSAYPRKVFFEKFTNTSCGPCATAAPIFADFYEDNQDNMTTVSVHAWWPGNNDPWYQQMITDCTARIQNYYAVNAVPDCRIDGIITVHPGNLIPLQNGLNDRLDIESPVSIDMISYGGDGSPITILVSVNAEEAVTGNHKLRIYLAEIFTDFAAPNGQNEWHFDAVAMAPDAGGIDFDMAAGGHETFEFEIDWDDDYDPDNLKVVAFIQNDNGHEVIQSAWADFGNGFAFDLNSDNNSAYVMTGSETVLDFTMDNFGIFDDAYDISVETDLPDGWSYSFTTPDGNFQGPTEIEMDSGSSFDGTVVFNSSDMPGESGSITLTFSSQGAPGMSRSQEFFVLNSSNLVHINDEAMGQFANYYSQSIEANEGPAYGTWNTVDFAIDYEGFALNPPMAIIWSIGNRTEVNPEHILFMTEFVQTGGNLYANGNDIASILNDTELLQLMGTDYRGRFGALHVYGADGDVIGDGMDFDLEGGDGANNLDDPCYFQDADGPNAANCFWITPNDTRSMAVRNEGEGYRTLVMGFPFEAIDNQADRTELMGRILDFIMYDMGGVGPLRVNLNANYFELVSTCLLPEDLMADQVFGNIENLQVVYQNNGSVYIPRLNMNSIGNINLTNSYRLYCSENSQWVIDGEDVDFTMEYNLVANRWNWISYPFYRQIPSEMALGMIQESFSILMTDDGRIWIPGNINTIGNMLPGEGYYIFPSEDLTFQYTDGLMKTGSEIINPVCIPDCEGAPQATGLPYAVLVGFTDEVKNLNPAYIEIYDGSLLVGKSVVLDDFDNTPVIAWGGSEEHGVVGFKNGNQIRIQILAADGSLIPLASNETGLMFGEGAYADLTLDLNKNTIPDQFTVNQGYPNPFNPAVTVPFAIPGSAEVKISVYNVLGQSVYEMKRNFSAGHHSFVFDASTNGSELVSGMYFVKINYRGQIHTQKLMLLK